jgi:predicted dithiol-disulfide oxidoreductase (DUF899 family)
MSEHSVATQAQWLVDRRELLEREKEHSRRADELARLRRQLPWVPIDKQYSFQTEDGTKTLGDLFDGRSQLLVYHFMFGTGFRVDDQTEGCTGCSFVADHFDGALPHLNARDVTLVCASRAPLEHLLAYKTRMDWRFPWVSSLHSDFSFDFAAAFTEQQQRDGADYNFQHLDKPAPQREGLSAFAIDGGVVHHTYSTYARGVEALMGTYQILDLAPRGRDEERLEFGNAWWRRHDEHGTP